MKFYQQLLITLFAVILTSVLTLVIKPYIDQKLNESSIAKLVKVVDIPDISKFPEDIKKQVTSCVIKYSLENKAGGIGEKLSIWVISDKPLMASQLKLKPGSEVSHISFENPSSFRIDADEIRPTGYISFELVSKTDTKIIFNEKIGKGGIFSPDEFKKQNNIEEYKVGIMVIFCIVLWFVWVGIFVYVAWKSGRKWRDFDVNNDLLDQKMRGSLISLLIFILIYNLILSSLSVVGGFLPVPRISFDEIFYLFAAYLLITKFKIIEELIKCKITENIKNKFSDKDNK
jgi:hypothetical protein